MTEQDKFTDHDPLIGNVNVQDENGKMTTDPTKLVDAITHTVKPPPIVWDKHVVGEYAMRKRRVEEMVLTGDPKRPGKADYENESEWRKAHQDWVKAKAQIRKVQFGKEATYEPKPWKSQDDPLLFNPLQFGRFEKRVYNALVFARKSLRNAGKRDSKAYRWLGEHWFRQINRMQGMKSEATYRSIGTRSHKGQESKAVETVGIKNNWWYKP